MLRARVLVALALTAILCGGALAKKKPKKPPAPAAPAVDPAEVIDVSAARSRMIVLHDGKQHYVTLVPFADGDDRDVIYYGDGKVFHQLRYQGYGRGGREDWSYTFWEPRVDAGWKSSIEFRANKFHVQCDTRQTELVQLPAAEAKAMLEAAQFLKPRWKRRAYALARDDRGRYYFVDRAREPENSQDFRLYIGPKGNLKPQKMVNVVSDSEGDIFSTRDGELRLVLSKGESVWIKKKQRTELVNVPVLDNHVMIYTDLGVYMGERLGTPCDDL